MLTLKRFNFLKKANQLVKTKVEKCKNALISICILMHKIWTNLIRRFWLKPCFRLNKVRYLWTRAGEQAKFFRLSLRLLFFFKRLRLWLHIFLSSSGSGSFSFKRLRLQGAKNLRLLAAQTLASALIYLLSWWNIFSP